MQKEISSKPDTRAHAPPLVDIREVSVDANLPKEQRLAEFVRQIKDPTCFRCGPFIVHARFSSGGPPLEDCLKQIIL